MPRFLRMFSTVVLLALACASADTHAYARVQEYKSAHRGFATIPELTSGQNPLVSAERVEEKSFPAGQCTSETPLHRYLYAYANPTVYTDPTGRQSVDSPRYALQQTLNLASNPREREIAAQMINDYDAAMQARADPTATGIANSFVNGTKGLAQLGADALYTIPEAVLPESMNLDSRARLGAFFTAIQHPVDTIAEGDRRLRYEGAQQRRAGDEFGASAKEAEADTNLVAIFFGGRALLKSGASFTSTTIAKIANRATPLRIAEGAGNGASYRFDDPAIIEELDDTYRPAGHAVEPAQVRINQFEGARRETETLADLREQYPNARVQEQVYLRTSNGKRAIDPLTGEARRVDFAVIEDTADGPKVVDMVETTSQKAAKDAQNRKEQRIRQADETYIRDRESKCLLRVCGVETRFDRRD